MVSKSIARQLILFRLIAAVLAATTFTDDKGLTHKIPSGAKVLCGAMDAVTFFHFGMEASQVKGTFGERSSSGSNFGGKYFDVRANRCIVSYKMFVLVCSFLTLSSFVASL